MFKLTYEEVVEAVKQLNGAERWRLRDFLDVLVEPPSAPMSEDEVEQEMMREGILTVPPPITDFTLWDNRLPVQIEGKALSETIIEERDREV